MKFTTLLTYSLSTVVLLGCGHMRASEKKAKTASAPLETSSETVDIDEPLIKKKGATNHELAEADAAEEDIQRQVGSKEIDEELPGSEKDEVPYSKDFLALKKTKRMQFWVEYFTKHQRERFQRFINNGEEYRHHIEAIFAEYGLPKELYYVGLIESGYYLGARSHAAAVGPWQFIKGTAKRYGLKVNHELDERQDLFKASRAAAMYFKDLHNVFSSWELALSAYNAGEYGIIRRIMKHGTRDFYELSRNKQLPSETINYVPKVLAAMHVINNAEKYGFVIPKKQHRLFDRTELRAVSKNTSLKTLAKRLGVSYELLRKLNPELKRGMTPRRFAGAYHLRVPRGHYQESLAAKVEEKTNLLPAPIASPERPEKRSEINRRTAATELKSPRFHRVKRGETLLSLSRRYGLTPREIAEANGFKSWRTRLQVGQRISLSKDAAPLRVAKAKVKILNRPIVYKVRPGDNLTEIARVFNQSLTKLKRANKLKRGSIMVGQKIVLPGTRKGIYTVKKGDHLTKVAKKFDQPLEALIKLNALKRRTIYPGQKIIVNMD